MPRRSGKYEPKKVLDDLRLALWTPVVRRRGAPAFLLYAPADDRLRIAKTIRGILEFGRGTRRFLAFRGEEIDLPYGPVPSDLRLERYSELVVRVEPQRPPSVRLESGVVWAETSPEAVDDVARSLAEANEGHGRYIVAEDGGPVLRYSPDWRGIE